VCCRTTIVAADLLPRNRFSTNRPALPRSLCDADVRRQRRPRASWVKLYVDHGLTRQDRLKSLWQAWGVRAWSRAASTTRSSSAGPDNDDYVVVVSNSRCRRWSAPPLVVYPLHRTGCFRPAWIWPHPDRKRDRRRWRWTVV